MYRITLAVLACLALVFMPAAIASANITYIFEQYVSNEQCEGNVCDLAVVGGTIETDGTLGALGGGNIVSVDAIMVESLSGNFGSSTQVSVDLSAVFDSLGTGGLQASLTELFVATNDIIFVETAGQVPAVSGSVLQYINQEGTGDPGRRIQIQLDGLLGQFRFAETSGNILVATIPEPGTAVLLMLGGLGILTATRRRSS